MKKLVVIFILTAVMTFSLAAMSKMEFVETTVDFGEIESGKIAELKFAFKNTGDTTLIIKNVSSSCGCTATRLEKKEYEPGESGVIPVKFNSKGYNGRVTKSITITTNDKENVYSRLKIKGKVNLKDFAAIEIEPNDMDFDKKKVKIGEEYKKKIHIRNTGSINLRIIEVQHSPEISTVFRKKIIKPGDELTVPIIFRPMQKGHFATFIKIRTNAYRQRLTIVKLKAEVEEG
ncbi:MAG: DUF1573 domain-containing protein [bacterium]|nr:DUF1573 domain-containing protein [bacterium]